MLPVGTKVVNEKPRDPELHLVFTEPGMCIRDETQRWELVECHGSMENGAKPFCPLNSLWFLLVNISSL